ncbi:MAG: ImmA/IrrE family metallo-endopeptidase [Planctomycetia bacterium]|nr:ImmA/IrrE family metallo-endopeptidase [Planctomycetia bacterium]
MTHYISVKPEVLQWAIRYSDLSEDAIYTRFPWVSNEPAQTTFIKLQNFAQTLRVPFSSLLLGKIPEEEPLPIPDCRTVTDRELSEPSLNLREIIHIMSVRQEWMHNYLLSEGAEPLPFVGSLKLITDPLEATKRILQDLNLKEGWTQSFANWEKAYEHLRDVVEEAGVLLFQESGLDTTARKRFNPEEFRGFVMSDTYAPLIFINSADARNARMFTLAHEIAHLWSGTEGVFDFAKEDFANHVAAELLVPEELFRKAWDTNSDIGHLSHVFKVSTIVIARRAWDCGLIPSDEFWAFFRSQQKKFETNQKKQKGNPTYYNTRKSNLSMNFVMSVIASAQSGKTLYRDACNLVGMHGKTFEEFANRCMPGMRIS